MQFHFENMKRKAQQRIKEGRPEPVDPLAVNLFLMPEFDASVSAPHAIFIGLTLSEVEDVREDIMTWQVGHWYFHLPLDLRTFTLNVSNLMLLRVARTLATRLLSGAFLGSTATGLLQNQC